MAASVSIFATPGMKTKAKFLCEEQGEEDYHNLPDGQCCLLSKEKNRWVKKEQEMEREERNRNSNKGFSLTTACSFISNLENSSGHACLDELEKFHTLRPATLTEGHLENEFVFPMKANLVQTHCRALSGPLRTPHSLAPFC